MVESRAHDMDYFQQCSCSESNPCVLVFTISPKLSHLPNLEVDSLLSRFYGSVRTKKCINGLYKTNIGCFFIAATQMMEFLRNGIFMVIWWLKYQFSFTNVISVLFSTYNDLGSIVWKKQLLWRLFQKWQKIP